MTQTAKYALLASVVTAAAVILIMTQINLDLFREALTEARYIYLLPGALFLVLGAFARAARWRILLSAALPARRTLSILNVTYMINGLVPFRAGEFARAYLATRADPPVHVVTSLTTVVVERLLDLLTVVLFLAFALAAGPVPDWLRAAGISGGVTALAGFLFLVFLSRQRDLAHRLIAVLVQRVSLLERLNVPALVDDFLNGLLPLAHLDTLLRALFWNAVSWGFSLASGYVLMYTFYDEASFVATCLYIAAASFAIAVPAVPGNVGTFEVAIMLALVAVGYGDETTATAFAVMVHVVNLGTYAALGVWGFIEEGVTISQLSRGVREVREAEAARDGESELARSNELGTHQ